jgi:hypothetical protein
MLDTQIKRYITKAVEDTIGARQALLQAHAKAQAEGRIRLANAIRELGSELTVTAILLETLEYIEETAKLPKVSWIQRIKSKFCNRT